MSDVTPHDHAMDTAHPSPEGGGAKTWIGGAFILAAILLTIFLWKNDGKREKATETSVAAAQPPVTIIRKTGKEKTLYRFDQTGCVEKFLRGGWEDYPKGGEIKFIDLETGKEVMRDKPGIARTSSLTAGNYRICKVDPAAWGVEIWE